jgi:hypothetical protein
LLDLSSIVSDGWATISSAVAWPFRNGGDNGGSGRPRAGEGCEERVQPPTASCHRPPARPL